MNDQCERCGIKLNSLIDYPGVAIKVGSVTMTIKTDLCSDCYIELCQIVKKFVKKVPRETTPTCKDCLHFVQGSRHSGTCKKRPYVSTKHSGVQMINGKPRPLILYWSHAACKMFERSREC